MPDGTGRPVFALRATPRHAEDRRQRTEDRGQKTEEQRAERQRTEDRRQKRQKTRGRCRAATAEGRGQKTEPAEGRNWNSAADEPCVRSRNGEGGKQSEWSNAHGVMVRRKQGFRCQRRRPFFCGVRAEPLYETSLKANRRTAECRISNVEGWIRFRLRLRLRPDRSLSLFL